MVKTGDGPGIDGGLMQRQQPGQPPANVIDVPSLADTAKTIVGAGGTEVVPKMGIPGVGWVAYFADTEQNVFGLIEYDAGQMPSRASQARQSAYGSCGLPLPRAPVPRDAPFGAGARPERRRRDPARGVRRSGRKGTGVRAITTSACIGGSARRRRGRRAGLLHHRVREGLRRGLRPGESQVPHVPAHVPRSVRAEPAQGRARGEARRRDRNPIARFPGRGARSRRTSGDRDPRRRSLLPRRNDPRALQPHRRRDAPRIRRRRPRRRVPRLRTLRPAPARDDDKARTYAEVARELGCRRRR